MPGRGGSPSGSGGRPTDAGEPGNNPNVSPDDSKPSPRAQSPDLNSDETVAPQNIPPSDLTLRKVQELLKDKDAASKLEQETGMSRDEMEQFVQKGLQKKPPKSADRQGQDIQAKPGQGKSAGPNPTLEGLDPRSSFSTKSLRERGSVVQDRERGNAEDVRLVVPPEIRSGYEAYLNSLSRSRTLNPSRTTPAAPGSGNR